MLVAGGQELVGVKAEAQRQRFLDPQAGLAPGKCGQTERGAKRAPFGGNALRKTSIHGRRLR